MTAGADLSALAGVGADAGGLDPRPGSTTVKGVSQGSAKARAKGGKKGKGGGRVTPKAR